MTTNNATTNLRAAAPDVEAPRAAPARRSTTRLSSLGRCLGRISLPGLALCVVACAGPPEGRSSEAAPSSDGLRSGTFEQTIPGSPKTIQMVPIAAPGEPPLWMSATEITWDAYDAFVFELDRADAVATGEVDAVVRPSRPYIAADHGFGHEGFPVICVNHEGARAFAEWLTAHTGRTFRLPTEAEWERACAASARGRDVTDHAWVRENAGSRTHAVGERGPDAAGLYDLLGNVAEWCIADDGSAVVRGGSYKDRAATVGCPARAVPTGAWNASDPQIPKSRWWLADGSFVGFRIVCEDEPSAGPTDGR